MSFSVPAVIASLLAAGLWPLLILVGAVVLVTTIALMRADQRDIPAVFSAFAMAFGIRKSAEPTDNQPAAEQRDTEPAPPLEQAERSEQDQP